MTATTPERRDWLEWRRNGIGSSDVAALVPATCPPWSSPWATWASKVGLVPDSDEERAPHLQLGLDLEPVIARWFTAQTGLVVVGEQTWLTHQAHDWARATVDGFVVESADAELADAVGVFESKYTSDPPWAEVPVYYVAQVQWAMFVSGLERAWVAAMHLPFGRPRFEVYEIERDELDISVLAGAADQFWHRHVLPAVPPPVDASSATVEALRAAYPGQPAGQSAELEIEVVEDLAAARAQLRVAEQAVALAENRVKAVMENATEGLIDGDLALTWRPHQRTSLDTRALRADHPDLVGQYVTMTEVRPLRLVTRRSA